MYCVKGEETNEKGDACVPCKLGFYKTQDGATKCTQCKPGFTTAKNGTIDPAKCDVRKYLLVLKLAVSLFLNFCF